MYLILNIYRTEPEICFERVRKRNRDGENKCERNLISKLHKYHELLFSENKDNKIYKEKINSKPLQVIQKNRIIIVNGNKKSNIVLQDSISEIIKKLEV